MNTDASPKNHYRRAIVVFAGCLLMVFVLPVIGIFLNSSLLFFTPQLLFPYDALVVREAYDSRAVFGRQTGLLLNSLHWSLVAGCFVWLARRLSVGQAILSAVAMLVIVGVLTNIGFSLFGVSIDFDGP
jgi:hypothetical protein